MLQLSTHRSPGLFGALHTFLARQRLRPAGSRVLQRRGRFQPRVEALEDRTVFAVHLLSNYNGLDFYSSDFFLPPDTAGAAGPTSYVETAAGTVAIFTPKATGASSVSDSFLHFFWVTGGLPHASAASALGDPSMVWDDQVQRFIVADHDFDGTGASHFDIAVSNSASPATLTTADWNFYSFDTHQAGYAPDYEGNMGYNHDAFVWTFNMFQLSGAFDHVEINSVSIADLVAGVPSPAYVQTQMLGSGYGWRPTVMHDSVAGDPMWFIQDGFTNTTLRVIKETDLLTTPSFSVTTLTVASKFPVVDPLQPDGTAVTTNIIPLVMNAAEYNNNIVAAQHKSPNAAGTEDDAFWYRIDVSSGTPTLADEGNVGFGRGTYTTYPGIDINADGLIGMSYMESGLSGPFLSVYITGRLPGDRAGTMETPVLVQAGARNYHDPFGRAGDFSGISVDADGTFWIANEFANTELIANWGTAIANFTIIQPPVPPPANARALKGIEQQFGLGSFADTNPGSISPLTVTVNYVTRFGNLLAGNGVPLLDASTGTSNGGGNTLIGRLGLNLYYGNDTDITDFDSNSGAVFVPA